LDQSDYFLRQLWMQSAEDMGGHLQSRTSRNRRPLSALGRKRKSHDRPRRWSAHAVITGMKKVPLACIRPRWAWGHWELPCCHSSRVGSVRPRGNLVAWLQSPESQEWHSLSARGPLASVVV